MFPWQKLDPHRPLEAEDSRYTDRPDCGGARLAKLLQAGARAIVVVGPVGCGKSTELARAAAALQGSIRTPLIRLDRRLNLRSATDSDILGEVRAAVNGVKALAIHYDQDGLLEAIRDAKTKAPGLILLIDGLEKAREDVARGLVLTLLDIVREESNVQFAVVLPPSLVYGPQAFEITTNTRVFAVRPVLKTDRRRFMTQLLSQRLAPQIVPDELRSIVNRAATCSGGVPRVFLQLMQDAALVAALRGQDLPGPEDLDNAERTQSENLGLLLRDGDREALNASRHTRGFEVPLERRLRFLNHGLLLEYESNGQIIVEPAPLLDRLLT